MREVERWILDHVGLWTAAGIALLLVIVIVRYVQIRRTAFAGLERWAAKHQLEVTHASWRFLFRGPAAHGLSLLDTRTPAGSQAAVFRIVVRDEHGAVRRGWLRHGEAAPFLFRLRRRTPATTVHWDD